MYSCMLYMDFDKYHMNRIVNEQNNKTISISVNELIEMICNKYGIQKKSINEIWAYSVLYPRIEVNYESEVK